MKPLTIEELNQLEHDIKTELPASYKTGQVILRLISMAKRSTALVEALDKIKRPTYGTEINDTWEEIASIYWSHIKTFQLLAKQALASWHGEENK